MIAFWTILVVLLLLLATDLAYRHYASGRIRNIIENVPPFGLIEATEPSDVATFRIPVTPDQALSACLYAAHGPARGLVVFCPEMDGNEFTALSYCTSLPGAGFSVLSFAFRNQGDSDHEPGYSPNHWVTRTEVADLDAVIEFIRSDDDLSRLPLGLFGVSRGGSAALLAGCRHHDVLSIVTDSAYSTRGLISHFIDRFSRHVVPHWIFRWLPTWHNQLTVRQALWRSERGRCHPYAHLEESAKNLVQPTLLISGARDSYVTPEVTQHLAELIGQPEHTWIVPRAKHNKARSINPQEYDRRVVSHFEQTLLTHNVVPAALPGLRLA
ncbi:MAG: alpha/beta hydrolase [Planctomycetaceae bacterium]